MFVTPDHPRPTHPHPRAFNRRLSMACFRSLFCPHVIPIRIDGVIQVQSFGAPPNSTPNFGDPPHPREEELGDDSAL